MWLQKDEYDNAHNGQALGIVCPFPVHSIKQRKLLDSSASSNANYGSRIAGKTSVYLSDMCVSGTSVHPVKCSKLSDDANRNNDNSVASLSESSSRSVICVNSTDKESERDGGSVRSILNILDSFKLEDMKEDKPLSSSPVSKPGISLVESNLLDGTVDPNANSNVKPEPLKEKTVGVFNEECLINGMSQGDRLQQIKSMRRHARATTTGALK